MSVSVLSAAAFAYILLSLSLLFVLFEEAVLKKIRRRGNISGSDEPVCLRGALPLRAFISAAFFCLSFYFIPMGSLPSFAGTRHDIVFLFAALIPAMLFSHFDSAASFKKSFFSFLSYDGIKFLFLLIAVFSLFALFASECGLPGELLSFETYAAPLLFESAGVCGKTAFVLFALSLAAFVPAAEEKSSLLLKTGSMLEALACSSLIAALFMPFNTGLFLGLFGLPLFGADFLLFWIKVFLIKEALLPCVSRIFTNSRNAAGGGKKAFLLFCIAVLLSAYDIYRIH